MPKIITFGEVRCEFELHGYRLLGETYSDSKTPMRVKCPKGHEVYMTRINFVHQNKRCIDCYKEDNSVSVESIRDVFEDSGYTLLSDRYINNYTHLEYVCNKGHLNKSTWGNFRNGNRCKYCAVESRKVNIDIVIEELKKYNYVLVKDTYTMAKESFEVICPVGHKTKMYLYNFRKDGRCGTCDLSNKTSKPEKEILAVVAGLYTGKVLENVRNIIPPFELDIYIPEKNLAIEYCGLYWHTDINGKSKNYHYNKYKMCLEKGIRLITIFEDEYLNTPQEVLSKIKKIVLNSKEPLFLEQKHKIVSDLRWDWHYSGGYYNRMGYKIEEENGPSLYKTIRVSKHNNVIYGKVWNCGKIIYGLKCQ